jgi:drug/metabolite transporter (DMT)-like permease
MPIALYGILLLLSMIWGGSFFFIKNLLSSFSPMEIAFLRSTFGLVSLLAIMIAAKKPLNFFKLPWVMLFIVGVLNSAIPWSLIAYSEKSITSSIASIFNATTPFWTVLIGVSLFRISLSMIQWLGILLGFIGIGVLVDLDWTNLNLAHLTGYGSILLATFCYGLSANLSKQYLHQLSVYQQSFGVLFSGAITSLGYLIYSGLPAVETVFRLDNILYLIGLGVFGSGVAYILFYILIQKGSAEFATLVTYMVPATAIFWGVVLLDESITTNSIIGLVLILCGVFISGIKKKQVREENLKSTKSEMTG